MDDGSSHTFLREASHGSESNDAESLPPLTADSFSYPDAPLIVYYSQSAGQTGLPHGEADHEQNVLQDHVVCTSFEELLCLLEQGLADFIIFDATVSAHEQRYIEGWSRIFNPCLRFLRADSETHPSQAVAKARTEVA